MTGQGEKNDASAGTSGEKFDPTKPVQTRDLQVVTRLRQTSEGWTGCVGAAETRFDWSDNGRLDGAMTECSLDLVNVPPTPNHDTPISEAESNADFIERMRPYIEWGPSYANDKGEWSTPDAAPNASDVQRALLLAAVRPMEFDAGLDPQTALALVAEIRSLARRLGEAEHKLRGLQMRARLEAEAAATDDYDAAVHAMLGHNAVEEGFDHG